MPDVEFTIADGAIQELVPIYRPIEPVRIHPGRKLLLPGDAIHLETATPNVVIRYTLDGSDPDLTSPRYEGAIRFENDMTLKARAFRPELTTQPLADNLTHASEVSRADYHRATLHQPVRLTETQPGLVYRYAEGHWTALSFFPELDLPIKQGVANELLDLSARNPDAPYYAFEYTGYLDIPEDGVYTLHAPVEYLRPAIMAGYELTVDLGKDENGVPIRWQVCQDRFALGTWSIGLQAGLHPFKLRYADVRSDSADDHNRPGIHQDQVWTGDRPALRISGPNLEVQAVPAQWLRHN